MKAHIYTTVIFLCVLSCVQANTNMTKNVDSVRGTVVASVYNATGAPMPYVQIMLFGDGLKFHNSTDLDGIVTFSFLKATGYSCIALPRVNCYKPKYYPVVIYGNETVILEPFYVIPCE